jgi:hypothetical protein
MRARRAAHWVPRGTFRRAEASGPPPPAARAEPLARSPGPRASLVAAETWRADCGTHGFACLWLVPLSDFPFARIPISAALPALAHPRPQVLLSYVVALLGRILDGAGRNRLVLGGVLPMLFSFINTAA